MAPTHSRLFFDFDFNKHADGARMLDDQVVSIICLLWERIEADLESRDGLLRLERSDDAPGPVDRQCYLNGQSDPDFAWCDSTIKDPLTCAILGSPIGNAGMHTYHIVFPFVFLHRPTAFKASGDGGPGDGKHTLIEQLFLGSEMAGLLDQEKTPARKDIDFKPLSLGTLRGFNCVKYEWDVQGNIVVRPPFNLLKLIRRVNPDDKVDDQRCGGTLRVIHETRDGHRYIPINILSGLYSRRHIQWRLSSILYEPNIMHIRTRVPPAVEHLIAVNNGRGDDAREKERKAFHEDMEPFSDETLAQLIIGGWERLPESNDSESETRFKQLDKLILGYLNKFVADVSVAFRQSPFVVKNIVAGSKVPSFLYPTDKNTQQIFASGRQSLLLKTEVKGKTKEKHVLYDAFARWKCNKDRLKFGKIDFTPYKPADGDPLYLVGALNLYYPPAVSSEDCEDAPDYEVDTPVGKVNLDLFLKYVLVGLCDGDVQYYNYLINWMAHALRFPEEPTNTAIVLCSDQGVGKDFFWKFFMSILGEHLAVVTTADADLGNFNSLFEGKTFVLLNECEEIASSHNNVLKRTITDTGLRIEHKGVDAIVVRNYVNIAINMNDENERPLKLPPGDRRLALVTCSNKCKDDKEFWSAMWKWSGKVKRDDDFAPTPAVLSFAKFLYSHPIPEGWSASNIPNTSFRSELKRDNLPVVSEWLRACITQESILGHVPAPSFVNGIKNDGPHNWPVQFNTTTEELHDCFAKWCNDERKQTICAPGQFGRELNKIIGSRRIQVRKGEIRIWQRVFPAHDVCKDLFTKAYRGISMFTGSPPAQRPRSTALADIGRAYAESQREDDDTVQLGEHVTDYEPTLRDSAMTSEPPVPYSTCNIDAPDRIGDAEF